MAQSYNVAIKVVSQKGTCAAGHRVDDEWVVTAKTPDGICISAFHSLFPSLRVLKYGGTFPWEEDSDCSTDACPDAANPVVFELRRLRE